MITNSLHYDAHTDTHDKSVVKLLQLSIYGLSHSLMEMFRAFSIITEIGE